jgi:hypothetical protein
MTLLTTKGINKMAGKDFTEYVLDKADDVIDVAEEIKTELDQLTGSVEDFVNDAVSAYRNYLLGLIDFVSTDLEN